MVSKSGGRDEEAGQKEEGVQVAVGGECVLKQGKGSRETGGRMG
jgi:hypothetical protein